MGRARRLHEVYPSAGRGANGWRAHMTLVVEQFDDVTRWRMSSSAGRAFGIGVSAYVYRGVMIDTGFHREGAALMRAAAAAALRGAVVTHWHEDHAGNVEALARRGIPLMMRQDTESILRLRPNIQLYRRAVWGRPIRLEAAPTGFDAPDFQCIHLPGHPADHQVVWFP